VRKEVMRKDLVESQRCQCLDDNVIRVGVESRSLSFDFVEYSFPIFERCTRITRCCGPPPEDKQLAFGL
jgi:hypothetical protein